jgi:alkylation response protein AidB-like acyl-CoA dehydrogenase
MDFEDSPDEAEFRAAARAFLEANAPRRKPGAVEGYRRGQDKPGALEAAKDFQRRKAAAGFAGINWPAEWGGRGGTQIEQIIYDQEEAQFDVLTGIFGIGINLALPTICTWARTRTAPASPRRGCAGRRCGASCSPNPPAGRTWRRCAPARCATATSGW